MDLAGADRVLVSRIALGTGLARAAADGAEQHQVVGEASLRRVAAIFRVEIAHRCVIATFPAFEHMAIRLSRLRRDDVAWIVVHMVEQAPQRPEPMREPAAAQKSDARRRALDGCGDYLPESQVVVEFRGLTDPDGEDLLGAAHVMHEVDGGIVVRQRRRGGVGHSYAPLLRHAPDRFGKLRRTRVVERELMDDPGQLLGGVDAPMVPGAGDDMLGGGEPVGIENHPAIHRLGLEMGPQTAVALHQSGVLPAAAQRPPDIFLQHHGRYVADYCRAHDLTHAPGLQSSPVALPHS